MSDNNATAPVAASDPATMPTLPEVVAKLEARLETLEERLDELERLVLNSAPPRAADDIAQELVDYLHWLFPAGSTTKPVPGTPTAPPVAADPPQAA